MFARGLLVRGIAVAGIGVLLASTLAGCTAPPNLGESVRTLIESRDSKLRESAARRVAASLNASACADVAAAAASDPSLDPYVGQIRTDLVEALDDTSKTDRKVAAIRCISSVGLDGVVEDVGWLADDADSSVRMAASDALAKDGSDEAVAALFKALASEFDDAIAAEKAALIARLPDAMDHTIAVFEETYDASETARIVRVAEFAGAEWVDALADQIAGDHANAAQAMLIAIGEPAVDRLVPMLRSSKYAKREAAAEILVSIERGVPGSVERLMSSIEDKDYKDVARYYLFYIRLGKPGTESVLKTALLKHGTKPMALDYLNCGNNKLESAAETWAHRHGYIVIPGIGPSGGPTWGEGL